MFKRINASHAQQRSHRSSQSKVPAGPAAGCHQGPSEMSSGMDSDILLCNNDLFFRRGDWEQSCLAIMWVLKEWPLKEQAFEVG